MLLDLNFKFKGLDGNEINEALASKEVARFLSMKTQGVDALKAMGWAYKLFNDGILEIDEVDLEILEKLIRDSEFSNLAKAQVLQAIKSCK